MLMLLLEDTATFFEEIINVQVAFRSPFLVTGESIRVSYWWLFVLAAHRQLLL